MILPYLAIAFLVLATAYAAFVGFRQKTAQEKSTWLFPAGARPWARILVGAATLAVVVAIGILGWPVISARNRTGHSLRFLVPEGYTGWVRVEFEAKGAPRLPVDADQAVARIPAGGKLVTSSPEIYAWAKDYFYSYSGSDLHELPRSGPQRMIWAKTNGEASGTSGKRKYEEFFVGTEQQYRDEVESGRKKRTE